MPTWKNLFLHFVNYSTACLKTIHKISQNWCYPILHMKILINSVVIKNVIIWFTNHLLLEQNHRENTCVLAAVSPETLNKCFIICISWLIEFQIYCFRVRFAINAKFRHYSWKFQNIYSTSENSKFCYIMDNWQDSLRVKYDPQRTLRSRPHTFQT